MFSSGIPEMEERIFFSSLFSVKKKNTKSVGQDNALNSQLINYYLILLSPGSHLLSLSTDSIVSRTSIYHWLPYTVATFLPILEESPVDKVILRLPTRNAKYSTDLNSPLNSRSIGCHRRTFGRPNRLPSATGDFDVAIDNFRTVCHGLMWPDVR